MGENFRFTKLSPKHKKLYILYQILLFVSIAIMTWIAISKSDPHISTDNQKIGLTIGLSTMIGIGIMALAFMNRLKSLLKVKFVAFLVMFVILTSLNVIMATLIWTIGLVLIPLMIDDLILLPIWRNIWYNTYE